jgi:hypothetical protein
MRFRVDRFGYMMEDLDDLTEDMSQPVRCNRCHGVYDLGTVTVTARYTACSVWKAPCCGAVVDDRGETGWKSLSDYTRIEKGWDGWS